VPITRESHGGRFWHRLTAYTFASRDHFAPLVGAEISRAGLVMPVAFARQGGRFALVGLLSPIAGKNFFVDSNGRWLGDYIPSCYRAYPFSLAPIKGQSKMALCVDESSGLVSDEGGESFFDENHELTQAVKEVLDFLQTVAKNRVLTDRAVDALNEAGLIVEWPLNVKVGDQETKLPNLYKIDEAGLNRLSGETFLNLRKSGSLPIAYTQLLSMGNVRLFQQLAQKSGQLQKPEKIDLKKILGDDDIFQF